MRKIWMGLVTAGTGIAATVALMGSTAPAQAQSTCSDGQNRWLLIQNLRPVSILYLKNRPAYSYADWSEDMLGSTATPPGASVYVVMPSDGCQCRADIQVTLESGSSRELTYSNVSYCSPRNGPRATLVVD